MPRLIALLGAAALTSRAQEPVAQQNDLQEQLQQLKRQYDTTTRDLEQRIAALEQQIQKQKEAAEKSKEGTVSSVELAAQQAAQKAATAISGRVMASTARADRKSRFRLPARMRNIAWATKQKLMENSFSSTTGSTRSTTATKPG